MALLLLHESGGGYISTPIVTILVRNMTKRVVNYRSPAYVRTSRKGNLVWVKESMGCSPIGYKGWEAMLA